MIHELLLSVTETAFGSHPCRVVSVTYPKRGPFTAVARSNPMTPNLWSQSAIEAFVHSAARGWLTRSQSKTAVFLELWAVRCASCMPHWDLRAFPRQRAMSIILPSGDSIFYYYKLLSRGLTDYPSVPLLPKSLN
jgi:hypothetical protein